MGILIRKPYDPVVRVQVDFVEPSLTQQSFAADCDINRLIERHTRTGMFYDPVTQLGATRKAQFGDFSNVSAEYFQMAQNAVVEAQTMFDNLPSEVRDRFNYSPLKLIEFLNDETNRDEAIKLGLVAKKDVQSPPPPPSPEG